MSGFSHLFALLGLLVLSAIPARAQNGAPFSLGVEAAAGWRPVVRVRGLLGDPALLDALGSGLPLRVHLRVELWEKSLFDRLVGSEDAFVALAQDPLDQAYIVETGRGEQRYRSLAEAETALRSLLIVSLRPPLTRRRFYYLGTLEIESLSLSDLEELRRWLRGEVRPAVQGRAPAERALARGISRLFVRLVGLPTRRYSARSATFVPR